MIKITIAKTDIRENKGVSMKSGTPKPYHIRTQHGYAFTVDKDGNADTFPEKFQINLNDDLPHGYAVGEYTLHLSSVYVDRDGKLAISPRLVPSKARASSSNNNG